MSGKYEERARESWAEWEKRKRTNKPKLLGKFRKSCEFCAHCTWVLVGKTNEFYCHRVYNDGRRVTIDMTGKIPEECDHFDLRSKYESNES